MTRFWGIIAGICTFNELTHAYTPIVIKKIAPLGPQLTPDVTDVSRDGGYSTLINGKIVWFYDDTECMDSERKQLSFVSNTAAYAYQPSDNVTTVVDFGVVNVGKDINGNPKNAILADTTIGTGGWVPFRPDELQFNHQMQGKERVAIWPGSSPTAISTTQAFLYAPLVYVDMKPQDPSKEYQGRGMTLISITAPSSGPVATRQGDLVIPGTQVGFGGFSTLLGRKGTDTSTDKDVGDRDLYMLGVTNSGLQLARVGINDLADFNKYMFWEPHSLQFTRDPPSKMLTDPSQIYISGTFSSGSLFYSPFFHTFLMIYFNKLVDSTFYARYLDLFAPLTKDKIWIAGGKDGQGIEAEDVEALVRYPWSGEQKLWTSPTGPGGFNYAGVAHPEYFNRQFFAGSLYPSGTPSHQRVNDWFGSKALAEADAGCDGKNLLLSWTSQKVGGIDSGIYEIQLAMVEFDDIPAVSDGGTIRPPVPSPTSTSTASSIRLITKQWQPAIAYDISRLWIVVLYLALLLAYNWWLLAW